MIIDKLENANKYFRMHPDFEKAFAFLNQDSLAVLPIGRYKIDGERIFAMIDKKAGKGKGDAKLEAHHFTIFTPEDAHALMVSTGEIHKVVIKVRKAE